MKDANRTFQSVALVIIGGFLTAWMVLAAAKYWGLQEVYEYPWLNFISFCSGVMLVAWFSKPNRPPDDTVLYTLFHKGRIVYIGITFLNRLGSRIDEHRRSGKVFDRVDFSQSYSRSKALDLEANKIRKLKPKYNRMHVD